jgi:hypothetical protein
MPVYQADSLRVFVERGKQDASLRPLAFQFLQKCGRFFHEQFPSAGPIGEWSEHHTPRSNGTVAVLKKAAFDAPNVSTKNSNLLEVLHDGVPAIGSIRLFNFNSQWVIYVADPQNPEGVSDDLPGISLSYARKRLIVIQSKQVCIRHGTISDKMLLGKITTTEQQ